MLRVLVPALLALFLSACQMTRDREAESRTDFEKAVQLQRPNIAKLCEQIQSEGQKRRCLSE